MSVLEKIRKAFGSYRELVVGDYQSLVRQVADGDEPGDDAAVSVLSSAGKTADDLAADVDRLVSRRAAAGQLTAAIEARREQQRLEERGADLRAQEAAETKAVLDKSKPMFDANVAAHAAAGAIANQEFEAKRILVGTADPSIDKAIQPLRQKAGEARREFENIRDQLPLGETAIGVQERNIAANLSKESHDLAVERLAAFQKNKRERIERLAVLTQEIASLQRQMADLEASKLAP